MKPFRIGKHPFFRPRGGYVEISDLIERVLDELHARFASSAPSFAPFTLEQQTLHHANAASIELADIDHVALGDGRIRIASRTGGEWVAAPMKTIDNSMLLVQELASRGIELQLSSEVFVPRTTLRMLSP